jgi:hypothetical protein
MNTRTRTQLTVPALDDDTSQDPHVASPLDQTIHALEEWQRQVNVSVEQLIARLQPVSIEPATPVSNKSTPDAPALQLSPVQARIQAITDAFETINSKLERILRGLVV